MDKMKKENIVMGLLACVFLYGIYRWATALHTIFVEKRYPFSGWNAFYIGLLLIGITGLLHYYFSQFKRSKILRAYLVFSLVVSFFSILFSIRMTLFEGNRMQSIQYLGLELIEFVIVCYSLHVLVAARKPEIINGSHFPAGKGMRFLNRVLDIIPFVIMVFSYYDLWNFFSWQTGSFDSVLFYPIEVVIFFLYYSLLEHFFHTTFGKTMTNTTVIHVNGQYASFSTILLRSICRFIPFDAFSFLFAKGWHDSISHTVVVDETYAEEIGV